MQNLLRYATDYNINKVTETISTSGALITSLEVLKTATIAVYEKTNVARDNLDTVVLALSINACCDLDVSISFGDILTNDDNTYRVISQPVKTPAHAVNKFQHFQLERFELDA